MTNDTRTTSGITPSYGGVSNSIDQGMVEQTAQAGKRQVGLRGRMTLSLLPAAAITCALVLGMTALISVDEVVLDEKETRELTIITPQKLVEDAERQSRLPPERLDLAATPPPPPRVSATAGDIDMPTPIIKGAAPKDLGAQGLLSIIPAIVDVNESDIQPIRPPVLSFPDAMASKGISGTCNVRFDVTVDGTPFNVVPNCSHSGFEREARRAMNKVQFIPKVVRGQRVERKNVVYPLEFKLDSL